MKTQVTVMGVGGETKVTGKFGLGIRNEVGQRLIEFAKRTNWS